MPKMIGGSIACRISYAPETSGKKFYCDFCGEFFDDRHEPPCEVRETAIEDAFERAKDEAVARESDAAVEREVKMRDKIEQWETKRRRLKKRRS